MLPATPVLVNYPAGAEILLRRPGVPDQPLLLLDEPILCSTRHEGVQVVATKSVLYILRDGEQDEVETMSTEGAPIRLSLCGQDLYVQTKRHLSRYRLDDDSERKWQVVMPSSARIRALSAQAFTCEANGRRGVYSVETGQLLKLS